MNLFDHSLHTPAENLAGDEALLDWCESGRGTEILHFWEPCETFVVVGYANKVATEVDIAACELRKIPVYRRCSGGGTVVQMHGGLNYALILSIAKCIPLQNIASANRFIMEKNRAAIATLFPRPLPFAAKAAAEDISVRGHTDLCLGQLKFAGNAQRRRKNYLLFHGTLLLDCDLKLISRLLPMPSLEPHYRFKRPHEQFVTNLGLPADKVKTALAEAWNAREPLDNPPLEAITRLAREKYSTRYWNFKL